MTLLDRVSLFDRAMNIEPMTKADTEALARLPDGWFALEAVSWQVRRPRFRCDRLVAAGALEWRVVGEVPFQWSEWRKVDTKKGAQP